MTTYRPTPEVGKILEWAKQEIGSVPYKVTARWTFYQIVQRYGLAKADYKRFMKWTSRARKAFWNGWHPDVLADDTRTVHVLDGGYPTPQAWIEHFIEEQCVLEVRSRQKNVVLVLYEAAAMTAQFEYYLGPLRVSYAPFRGDTSIPHKWGIAKRLERIHKARPKKPIVVLYFGDLDPKGLEIPNNALKDIWNWIEARDLGDTLDPVEQDGLEEWRSRNGKFRWIRVGLNEDQVQRLNIPENPEKPGTYQWEALSDAQAGELILEAVRRFWDEDVVRWLERDEVRAEERWRQIIRGALEGVV